MVTPGSGTGVRRTRAGRVDLCCRAAARRAAAVPSGLQGVVPSAPRNALQGVQGVVLPSPSEVRQKRVVAAPAPALLAHAPTANHAAPSAAPYALPGLYDARVAAASAAPLEDRPHHR